MQSKFFSATLAALSFTGLASTALAYDASGAWPDGTVSMVMQLAASADAPNPSGGSFIDGSASWDAAVRGVIDDWNLSMTRTKFAVVTGTNPAIAKSNLINNVAFQKTIYGTETWGDRVLAITYWRASGVAVNKIVEADVIFNANLSWNSYRGSLRTPEEIRRVALHEFGHVIGLDHPDQATPVQSVSAIMNSTVSNTEALQTDDRSGAVALYGTALPVPSITASLPSRTVTVGASATYTVQVNGATGPDETLVQKYAWYFKPTGGTEEMLFTVNGPTLYLGSAQLDDRGTYRVSLENVNGSATSNTATLNVTAVTTSSTTRMAGLSTRGIAGTGSRTMIVGFIVSGTGNRRVLVRGGGPSLAQYFSGTVTDPVLQVYNTSAVQLAQNDNWQDGGQGTTMSAAFTAVGVPAFASGSKDAALIVTLAPGVYTAQLTPKDGVEGIALIEAYDLDATTLPAGRLSGLSTRTPTAIGNGVLTGGLIVSGSAPRTFLVRALGDSLQTFGVTGTLDDPLISLYQLSNGNSQKIRVNDDWDSPGFLQTKLTATATTLGLNPATLSDRQESAIQVTLVPGVYTVEVSGFGATTGVTLLEIYEVPE